MLVISGAVGILAFQHGLRDYLYIPLGGSRCSKWLSYRNLFITMTLGGLWHGAAFHFLLWGAFQGVILILHKEYLGWLEKFQVSKAFLQSQLYHIFSVILYISYLYVLVGCSFAPTAKIIAWQSNRKTNASTTRDYSFQYLSIDSFTDSRSNNFPSFIVTSAMLAIAQVMVGWLNNKRF